LLNVTDTTGGTGLPSKRDGRQRRGRLGEDAAVAYLESCGYRIVDTNVRLGARRDGLPGELDIVAWDGPTLCFVEVKARRSGPTTPIEGITRAKQRRIARLALAYAARAGLLDSASDVSMRFDIVSVVLRRGIGESVSRIDLAPGAFMAPDDFSDL
jgi:putative endonuclease